LVSGHSRPLSSRSKGPFWLTYWLAECSVGFLRRQRGGRRTGESRPPTARQAPIDEVPRQRGANKENETRQPFLQNKLADGEHAAIDQRATHDPVKRICAEVAHRLDFGRQSGDVFPAMNRRLDAAIEID